MPNIPLSSAPKESCLAHKDNDRFKVEKIKHLNTEVFALKEFILEQLYVSPSKIFVLKTLHPNNVQLIKALKRKRGIFGNEIQRKPCIIIT